MDLGVAQQKNGGRTRYHVAVGIGRIVVAAAGRGHHGVFQIVVKIHHRVIRRDSNLFQFKTTHVPRQIRQTLTTTATHPDQQRMPTRCAQDSGHSRHVLNGVIEQHQPHRFGRHEVVFLQLLHHGQPQHLQAGRFLVCFRFHFRVQKITKNQRVHVLGVERGGRGGGGGGGGGVPHAGF